MSTCNYAIHVPRSASFPSHLLSPCADRLLTLRRFFSQSSALGINASTAPHYPTRTTWYVKLRTSQVMIPSTYHPFGAAKCSDCEIKSYKVHDPMHLFLKLPRPVDIPGPLESEFPIIPVLYVENWLKCCEVPCKGGCRFSLPSRYRDAAGPVPGSPAADISGDPAGT